VSSLKDQVESQSSGKEEQVKKLEEEKALLEAQLVDEKEKSSGLESQLADLLAERPRYV
jgi:hypothetical protein